MNLAKNKITCILGFLIAILFLSYSSIYTVAEGYTALLGKTNVTNAQLRQVGPGLHIILPFSTQLEKIDLRLHSIPFKNAHFVTLDEHPLLINFYTKWKITNPILYYHQTHNDRAQTQQNVTQIVNKLFQTAVAQSTLDTIINQPSPLTQTLKIQANQQLKTLGVSVIDIGFNSIDFPTEANNALLKKRRLEQTQIALEQRNLGNTNAENIRLKADNEAALELAKVMEKAAFIRGQGDAEAAKIYSAAYQKNPQFAAFYLNLEAYIKGFTQSSTRNNFLVLDTKEDFFNAKENLRLKP